MNFGRGLVVQVVDGGEFVVGCQVFQFRHESFDQLVAGGGQIDRLGGTFEHFLPLGFVGNMLLEGDFDQAGVFAVLYPDDGEGSAGALVDPAGGDLAGTGDADFDARSVGKIDVVGLEAVGLAPFGFAAGALVEVALFRFDDAQVALCQSAKTGVAIALVEAFAGFAAAVDAVDRAAVAQVDLCADGVGQVDRLVAELEAVLNRIGELAVHFVKVAGIVHASWFVWRSVMIFEHGCSSNPRIPAVTGRSRAPVRILGSIHQPSHHLEQPRYATL